MKSDKLVWGILFVFIGSVLLLENFGIINFYWGSVWHLWPVILIVAGLNLLLRKQNSNAAATVTIIVLVATLGFVFVKGMQRPTNNGWWGNVFNREYDINVDGDNNDGDDEDKGMTTSDTFSAPYTPNIKKAQLNISGGGTQYNLSDATDSLIAVGVQKHFGKFSMSTSTKDDSLTVVDLSMKGKNVKWNMDKGNNSADIRLNANTLWDISVQTGAGAVDFDLSRFKINSFAFDGGAASLQVKFGVPETTSTVTVKSGVASVELSVPEGVGCQIKSNTGLSSKDFQGFNKTNDGFYQTDNFASAAKKIYINLDGGLSSFEVKRY